MGNKIKILPYEKVIIFDTEYTTWEGARERKWSGPNEYKEIVQIGAVLIETDNFSELDSISILVKPVRNPILSEFFMQLTGITQEEIDREGLSFPDAVKKFFDWSDSRELYCYGTDGEVLEGNAQLLGIPFHFPKSRFHNISEIFCSYGIDATKYMSSTIVRAFGEEPVRVGHAGLNDARTIVDGLRLLKKSPEVKNS